MKPGSVVDFQLLILRPASREDNVQKFAVKNRENFGVRRLFIRRKSLKVLLEYNTLPAKVMELSPTSDDMFAELDEEDQPWQLIGSKISRILFKPFSRRTEFLAVINTLETICLSID